MYALVQHRSQTTRLDPALSFTATSLHVLQLYLKPAVHTSISIFLFHVLLVAAFLCDLTVSTVLLFLAMLSSNLLSNMGLRVEASSIFFFLAGSARAPGSVLLRITLLTVLPG